MFAHSYDERVAQTVLSSRWEIGVDSYDTCAILSSLPAVLLGLSNKHSLVLLGGRLQLLVSGPAATGLLGDGLPIPGPAPSVAFVRAIQVLSFDTER